MRFTKAMREQTLRQCLEETKCERVTADIFLDWLRLKRNHPCHKLFFGKSDSELAHAMRVQMFRSFTSDLRQYVVPVVTVTPATGIKLTVASKPVEQARTVPLFISPPSSRRDGGGYVLLDPADEALMDQLRIEGAKAMASWLERYGGAFAGLFDMGALERIAGWQPAKVAEKAA